MPRLTPRRAALAVLALGVVAAPAWMPPLLRELPVFAVARVEVSGVRLLAPHEAVRAAGIRAGQSIWYDLAAREAALRRHPAVADAEVSRGWPATLRLRVEEKRPVALLDGPALRLATEAGELLPLEAGRSAPDLPILRMIGRGAPDARAAELRRALAETGRLTRLAPELVARVSELRRARDGTLHLVLARPYAELLMPEGLDARRLSQLRAALEQLERRVEAPSPAAPPPPVLLDFRYRDQLVVRLPSSAA